jgi:hypothetical protein
MRYADRSIATHIFGVHAVRCCIAAAIYIAIGLAAHSAEAQTTGQFLGTVRDESGAPIAAAKLSLRNPATGLSREAATDSDGAYRFLTVPAGEDYVIEVDAPGFQKTARSGLKLLLNQDYLADFTLHVGQVKETLTVTASPVQVESTSTQLGEVIEDKKIEALPLNGRSYLDLLGLQAGVTPVSNPSPYQPLQTASGSLGEGEVSVNGQRQNANAYMVNGASVEDTGSNGAGIIPTLDSIQEFRLLTNTVDAEFGHFSGAIVNVITNSGNNSLHGSGFEFLRNDKLDSRGFFDPTRGVLQRNQFGGTIGGPIRKNRLFFYGDYQGTRQNHGLSDKVYVPSAGELLGNFSPSQLTGIVRGDNAPGHMAANLSSLLGYTVTAGEPYYVSSCTSLANAQAGMCVFPNAAIPKAAWSSSATDLLQFVPGQTGVDDTGPFFSSSALIQHIRDDKWGMRIDFAQNATDNWSFYYHFDDALVINPFNAPNSFGTNDNVPGFDYDQPSRAQLIVVSNTKIISSSKVNEAHISYHRIAFPGPIPSQGLGKVSQFGFTEGGLGLIPSRPSIEGVPNVILNNLGLTMGAAITDGAYQNNYQAQDGFSWIVGKHSLKMGGGFAYRQWTRRGGPAPNGLFVYEGLETGNDFADFLLGAPDLFNQSSAQSLDARAKSGDAYIQDNFRIRPNLTLNYGVRWEFSQPWYDSQNKIQAFIPGEQSKVFADSPTGWVFPGDPGVPTTLAPTRWHSFAPRLGLAYSPDPTNDFWKKILGGPGETSIRAGTGIFYTSLDTTGAAFETGDAPFGFYYVSPSLVYMDTPFKGRASGTDPGQRFPFVEPPLNGSPTYSFAPFLPIALSPAFKGNNVLPYAMDFNLTLQRQLGKSTIFSVGYIGTQGRHLVSMMEFNPGNPQKCLQIAQLFTNAGQPGGCGPGGEDVIYSIGGQTFYGTRPYSVTSGRHLNIGELDFGDNPYTVTSANSSYNSLQVSLDKRVGRIRFLGAYTWSKAMDNSSGFTELVNPYNPKLSRGLSSFDLTNNFVVSYSYDLPFDHWLSGNSGPAHKILHGWQLVGTTRFVTGFPITLQELDDQTLCGCDGQGLHSLDLPNYNGQPIHRFDPRSASHLYFDTSVFTKETLGVPGNANRRFFHGPGINNWDMALHKDTHITERTALEFRLEFFNVFNHAQFLNPGGNFGTSNFGVVTAARDPRIGQVALKLQF